MLDNGEIEELQTSIEEINNEERNIQSVLTKIDKLTHESQILSENYAALSDNMTLFDGDDKELIRMLDDAYNSNKARSEDIEM